MRHAVVVVHGGGRGQESRHRGRLRRLRRLHGADAAAGAVDCRRAAAGTAALHAAAAAASRLRQPGYGHWLKGSVGHGYALGGRLQ